MYFMHFLLRYSAFLLEILNAWFVAYYIPQMTDNIKRDSYDNVCVKIAVDVCDFFSEFITPLLEQNFHAKVKWFKALKQGSHEEADESKIGSQDLNQNVDFDNSWEPSQDGIIAELRVLAEVNVLCTSEQGAQWVPLIDSLIPINATFTQHITSGTSVIHLGADGGEKTLLDLQITSSESKLKKCSECFVRWKDVQSGKVWGLNFLSEQEALEFMSFCEDSYCNVSSGASSQSLNRKSSSSLSSSLNQKDFSRKLSSAQQSPRSTLEQDPNMPQGEAIFKNNRKSSRFPGTTDCADSGVGEDEMQDALNASHDEFNLTEFSYFAEMEIFRTAVNEKYLTKDKERIKDENIRAADTSSGGLRRSGWLSMKHILICGRNGRVEQASNRKWKNYWVILKDRELNLYQCDEKDMASLDTDNPSIVLKVDGCLAQAIPEHVKLEHVFGVSTENGDAFYFQGSIQSEVEGWISSIHSASAVLFTGSRGKEQTRGVLSSKLEKIKENIESDCKLKKMAELQLTVVTDSKNKQVIAEQISKWEQNYEKLSLDFYKLQCYLSAVSGCSPPNPQHVLASACKSTKQNMSRLGVFSVTSFHSLVSCRENGKSATHLGTGHKVKRSKSGVGYVRLKSALMSSLKITDSSTATKVREQHSPKLTRKESVEDQRDDVSTMSDWKQIGNFLRVELPGHGSTVVSMKEDMTFQDVVHAVTSKRHLDPEMYFIMFGVEKQSQIEYYTPQEQTFIEDQNFNVLILCKKSEYKVRLTKTNEDCDVNFGLSLKVEGDRMIVSRVLDGSGSHLSGILEGDEILSVNDIDIEEAEDDITDLQNALTEPFISLKLRSLRDEVPEQIRKTTESIISTLVCPPPPKTSLSEYVDLTDLIVPPPELDISTINDGSTRNSCFVEDEEVSVNVLLQSAEEVTTFCRQHDFLHEIEKQTELSDAEKLRKIILELVDTEKNYLKDVQTLLKRYLEPLRHEKFLPTDEVNSLAENVSQIIDFQSGFCSEIQQLIDCEEDFRNINEVDSFQNVVYGIGEAFLQYADKFKLYSSFCVTHSRIIHMLQPGSNYALEEFLNARNPKQQHSSKLESYLIKPIQRVLKYPLLLNGMSNLLDKESDEYKCLSEAISALENVAKHINEMQNITEQFLPIFQELAKTCRNLDVSDVDVDKLIVHKRVTWLNSPETIKATSLRWSPSPLRKMKNESTVRFFVFPKAVILIQMAKRQKKRDKSSKGSMKVFEEINFKTLIPMSSLTLRDNSWCDKDLFCAWELVDMSRNENGQQENLYLLSSRNSDERNETVRAIKEAIRQSMLEDSNSLSRRKPSVSNILSTTSIHLAFPGETGYLRRSFSESRGANCKSLGRQNSISEVEMFGGTADKR